MANPSTSKETPTSQPMTTMSVVAPAIGWLIPGAGHLIQKRWIRGLLLMGSIVIMFVLGLALQGRVYRPNGGDILDILGFVGDVGAGGGPWTSDKAPSPMPPPTTEPSTSLLRAC
jgi:hypothetical protein